MAGKGTRPSFFDTKRVYLRPIQSVNSFESYRAYRFQTDTFVKACFSGSEGLKAWTFDETGGWGGGV